MIIIDRLLKFALMILVTVYVLLALYFSAGRFFMPKLTGLTESLVQRLEAETGLQWDIVGLSGEWRKLNPVISVQRVSVQLNKRTSTTTADLDLAQGETDSQATPQSILLLQGAKVRLDVIGSVLDQEIRIADISVQAANVVLQDNGSGGWTIAGMAGGGDRSFAIAEFMERVCLLDIRALGIALAGADSTTPESSAQIDLPPISLHAARYGDARRFVITQEKTPNNGSFVLFADTDSGSLLGRNAIDVYAFADEFDVTPWMSFWRMDWDVKAWSGEVWASRYQGGRWKAALSVTDGEIFRQGATKKLSDISVSLGAEGNGQGGINVWWRHLSAKWDGAELHMPRAAVSVSREHRAASVVLGSAQAIVPRREVSNITIKTSEVDIGQLKEMLIESELLNVSFLNLVESLNPSGEVKNLHLSIPNGRRMQEFEITADLKKVNIDPWNNIPGATGITGYLSASAVQGQLQLESLEPASVSFSSIYRSPFYFQSMFAELNWSILGERLFLESEHVKLISDENNPLNDLGIGTMPPHEVNGSFFLNAKLSKVGEPTTMELNIGVRDAKAEALLRYLPFTVDESLQQWITESEIQGEVIDGAFIYNGSLAKNDAMGRSINLYFNVANANLVFDPDWPRVEGIDGLAMINDAITTVNVQGGEINSVELNNTDVALTTAKLDTRIHVTTGVAGDLGNVLEILMRSPLEEQLGGVIGSWRAKGALSNGELVLDIPLNGDDLSDAEVEFTSDLDEGYIDMRNLGLDIDKLTGVIRYSTRQGLFAERLDAELWRQPIVLRLGHYDSDDTPREGLDHFRADVQGTVKMKALYDWLEHPVLFVLEGKAPFELTVDYSNQKTTIWANSSLQGTQFNLPDDLFKPKETALDFQLEWQLNGESQPLFLSVEKRLSAELMFQDFTLLGGEILLSLDTPSGAAKESDLDEWQSELIQVSGQLQTVTLTDWQSLLDEYLVRERVLLTQSGEKAGSSKKATGGGSDLADSNSALVIKDLQLGRLSAFDQLFTQNKINVKEQSGRWRFDLSSDQFEGSITLPNESIVAASMDDESGSNSLVPSHLSESARIILDGENLYLPSSLLLEGRSEPSVDANDTVVPDQGEKLEISEGIRSFLAPEGLLPMQVNIEQLFIGNKEFGHWQFLLSPSESAALVHGIKGDLSSLRLRSEADSGLLWGGELNEDSISSLELSIASHDIQSDLAGLLGVELAEVPVRSAATNMDVSVSWEGDPTQFALESLQGKLLFDFEKGQFLKASGSAEGLLKILGLINFDSLLRRVQLDFTDIYKDGLSFDQVQGEFRVDGNLIYFDETPITVAAPSSHFLLRGKVDLNDSTIDAELVATLPVRSNLPWIAALAGGIPVAAGVFIASKVFEAELDNLSSAVYRIDGSLDDPNVEFLRLFEGDNAQKESNKRRVLETVENN